MMERQNRVMANSKFGRVHPYAPRATRWDVRPRSLTIGFEVWQDIGDDDFIEIATICLFRRIQARYLGGVDIGTGNCTCTIAPEFWLLHPLTSLCYSSFVVIGVYTNMYGIFPNSRNTQGENHTTFKLVRLLWTNEEPFLIVGKSEGKCSL